MNEFILTQPVRAIQYKHGNERAVFELVCRDGRRASFTNAMGDLHIFNDGPNLHIEEGQWVVPIAADTLILPPHRFAAAFKPA